MEIILKPFSLLLMLFYNLTASYGWALILFAVVIKVILFPFSLKGKKRMIKTTMLQGQVQKIQKQYANNKQKQSEEMQKLYKDEGVSPMGGCLWSLLPLLILLPLYAIIRQPLTYLMNMTVEQIVQIGNEILNWAATTFGAGAALTAQTANAGHNQLYIANLITPENVAAVKAIAQDAFAMNFGFFGLNLAQVPTFQVWEAGYTWNWPTVGLTLMPILSAALSLLMTFVTNKTNAMNGQSQQSGKGTNMVMYLMGPVMSLWIGYVMPAGLCVYWIINSILSIGQEFLCSALLKKDYAKAAEAKRKQELLAKEEEKRKKEALSAERARRAEEKKAKGKKKDKSAPATDQSAISASRVGIRAYARGRAYDPNRYGGVTEYKDPNAAIDEEAIEKALEAKAEAREQAAEEAEIQAAVQAKVDAEMEALQGDTAEEVAQRIEAAHAAEAQAAEATEEAAGEAAEETAQDLDKAWEKVTSEDKPEE